MKKITILCLVLIQVACNQIKVQEIYRVTLDDQWRFKTGDQPEWANPGTDDSDWNMLSSSRVWEEQGYEDYDGYAWYRKSIGIPGHFKKQIDTGGEILLSYDNADDVDALYFNGHLVGNRGTFPPQYRSRYGEKRHYRIPASLIRYDSVNVIAIRVYDGGGGGGIISDSIYIRQATEIDLIEFHVKIEDPDWIFSGDDTTKIGIRVKNSGSEKTKVTLILEIRSDDYQPAGKFTRFVALEQQDTATIEFLPELPGPGFYRCTVWPVINEITGEKQTFTIGKDPEKIISPTDGKADLKSFWENTRKKLDLVPPDYHMTWLENRSGGSKDLYLVSMRSFGDILIEGYYAVPKQEGTFPVIVGYMGYGSEPYLPDPENNPGFAEFILSVRGQGIQKSTNTYGEWIIYGLDSKENYYYRGAFMDLVRAIDFVCSRPEVDTTRIVAEGGSQGGAFTFAACALDHRIRAGAPTIPFLSDYRDYFKIVGWPRELFETYMDNHPDRSWDEIYDLLTYFDIKNLAPWIECPLIMAVGLQDEVCPPHINFAAFNQVRSEKSYHVFPDQGHNIPQDWWGLRADFIKSKLGL